ncbi:hypothetical protein Vadar_001052 [Vaccinium darrowii]|uniref:Uncharacterized protein n=1 Tax=Vaccinium darrowii TaxID=229202 RepID=A0ACB7X6S0_9ERIC|nr:hypothetical protein Vadar_001052 [Vaccinium darrowii]
MKMLMTSIFEQRRTVEDKKKSSEKDVYWKYIPLYQAALRGDWSSAESFFNNNEGTLTAKINVYSETALHVAAGAGRLAKSIDFVKKLVDKILEEAPGKLVLDTISEEALEILVPDRKPEEAPGKQVDNISEEAGKKLEIGDRFNCTPLHIAGWAGNNEVVKILLRKRPSLIYIRDDFRCSALDMAARNAKKDTLNFLLDVTKGDPLSKLFPKDVSSKKNDPSPNSFPVVIKTPSEPIPDIIKTPPEPIYNEDSAAAFLIRVITSGYYDIALDLVERYPELAFAKQETDDDCGLKALARKVSAFKSGSHYKWWQRLLYALLVKLDDCTTSHNRGDIETGDIQIVTRHIYNWARLLVDCFCTFVPCMKNIQAQKKMHHQALKLVKCLCEGVRSLEDSDAYNLRAKDALLTAAKLGIHEVMEEIVESFPNLLWAKDDDKLNIFQIAVKERHANVFNLIFQMGDYRQVVVQIKDDDRNNLLHLAGKLGPNKNNPVSGAALQMQRELQWFEEVKKFANPRDIDWPNSDGETPTMLFNGAHEPLRAQGEKWMKKVASSCTIPAALIVTVVFAAAITVPGGIDGTNGQPILSKEVVFNIFAVSNAISLFAAITSLLVSLSILTCRYAEGDFLFALPNRLIIGLITLFLSITTMVIAFSAALYLMFENKDRAWILYPVAALACIPIISFASLQFPLLVDLMVSTYGPGIFGKQSNRPFY